jgi:hypothetical protein
MVPSTFPIKVAYLDCSGCSTVVCFTSGPHLVICKTEKNGKEKNLPKKKKTDWKEKEKKANEKK